MPISQMQKKIALRSRYDPLLDIRTPLNHHHRQATIEPLRVVKTRLSMPVSLISGLAYNSPLVEFCALLADLGASHRLCVFRWKFVNCECYGILESVREPKRRRLCHSYRTSFECDRTNLHRTDGSFSQTYFTWSCTVVAPLTAQLWYTKP